MAIDGDHNLDFIEFYGDSWRFQTGFERLIDPDSHRIVIDHTWDFTGGVWPTLASQ